MADAFIGEIRAFPYMFAPQDWAYCWGQQVPQQQYPALYSLIGPLYGTTSAGNFLLPNLQGRVPVGAGSINTVGMPQPLSVGASGGVDTVTLSSTQIASHTHQLTAYSDTLAKMTASAAPGTQAPYSPVGPATPTVPSGIKYPAYTVAPTASAYLNPITLSATGGSAAHDNHQPYQVVPFCICMANGFYPIRP